MSSGRRINGQRERKVEQAQAAFDLCVRQKRMWGKRLDATRKLFKKKVFAVDLHSHSTFSDGLGTIAENCKDAKERARLDFLFCTDHFTIAHKRSVSKIAWAGLGQESYSGGFDIGLLLPRAVHTMEETVLEGMAGARRISDFSWIPHPVDFGDITEADLNRIAGQLGEIDGLAIEVMNGYDAPTRAYPRTGVWGARLFDRLLTYGRRVTPLGVSDAHTRLEIGNAWSGVYASECTEREIVNALNLGRCFASEAALLDFSCNSKRMGSSLSARAGDPLQFSVSAADADGLASVKLISGGKVKKEYRLHGKSVYRGKIEVKAGAKKTYYRLEVTSSDDRRAFSSPIYIG